MSNRSDGFVLPYVLVTITLLALILSMAAIRIQAMTQSLTQVRNHSQLNLAMQTAQSEAVFSLMTGAVKQGGVDLNPDSLVETSFGILRPGTLEILDDVAVQNIEVDIWSVLGGRRLVQFDGGRVLVELNDTSGLVSLNNLDSGKIQKLLAFSGVATSEAAALEARLKDYIDEDNQRQFRGAERSDYKLRGLPFPANAPIRSHEELFLVMGWAEHRSKINTSKFRMMTTVDNGGREIKAFMSPELLSILNEGSSEQQDTFVAVFQDSSIPSTGFRLKFWYALSENSYRERVIDVKRTANSAIQPFIISWVLERNVNESQIGSPNLNQGSLKNVLFSSIDRGE